MAEHAPESEEEAPAPEAEREGSERAEREPTERPDDGAAASGEEPKAANSAADNYGQLVQDAVIYGGMHIHTGAGDGPYTGAEATRLVRAARRLDPRRVEAVRASFVRPEHYPHFEREFRDSRVGVIVGPSGAGRAVTAVYALDRTGLPSAKPFRRQASGTWGWDGFRPSRAMPTCWTSPRSATSPQTGPRSGSTRAGCAPAAGG
ncbi:hypothetical protein ACFQXA_37085 [Nocardiopsis composta]